MQIEPGQVAVVTGGGSGIGAALARRFASAGMRLVLADIDDEAMAAVAAELEGAGTEVLAVHTDVSKLEDVEALCAATLERFGAVHVVCNNAGVANRSDSWFGPLSAWEWVIGINLWGVVYGVRTFLPHLLGGGHIVNTASMAGLMPGFGAAYDASKHAVVALTEGLYNEMTGVGLPVGVSVLCPGWVATGIFEADRNWPDELGEAPEDGMQMAVMGHHLQRAIAEGSTPAAIADAVFSAVTEDRFWVVPHQDFLDLAVARWDLIAERANPMPPENVPGLPPRTQMIEEALAALAGLQDGDDGSGSGPGTS